MPACYVRYSVPRAAPCHAPQPTAAVLPRRRRRRRGLVRSEGESVCSLSLTCGVADYDRTAAAAWQTVQAIAVVWMQSVYYFADPDAARGLVASAWWQVTMPLMVRLRVPSRRGAQTLTLLTAWCPADRDNWMRGPGARLPASQPVTLATHGNHTRTGVFLLKVCLIFAACASLASLYGANVNGTRQVLLPLRQVAVLRPNRVRDVRRSRGRVPLRVSRSVFLPVVRHAHCL